MNEQLLQELLRLLRRDEDTRARLLEAGALFGTYDEALQQVHRDNAARLDELLQRYGAVLDWSAAGELDCEVEDPEGLDARRAAVGLPPFREALEHQRREIRREGGAPPEDYADYRRRARAWAKGTGW
jgi:hypothetical protein